MLYNLVFINPVHERVFTIKKIAEIVLFLIEWNTADDAFLCMELHIFEGGLWGWDGGADVYHDKTFTAFRRRTQQFV